MKQGNLDNIENFLFDKFRIVVWKVLLNLSICTASIIILGLFFGNEALVTFLIGINFVGIHLILGSIITGSSSKNA